MKCDALSVMLYGVQATLKLTASYTHEKWSARWATEFSTVDGHSAGVKKCKILATE